MRTHTYALLLPVLLLLLLAAARPERAALTPQADPAAADSTDPVDFRLLKDLLPDTADGFSRTNARGQKTSGFGVKMSSAEADYESEDGERSMHLTITDMGSLSSVTMFGYAWLMTEIDMEDDYGYQRTTTYQDFPAYEEYSDQDGYRQGDVQVVVARRFIVQATGSGTDMETIQALLGRVDLAALAALAQP